MRFRLDKLFPDSIICQEKLLHEPKSCLVANRTSNDRRRDLFHKPRDGRTGRYTGHETEDHEEDGETNSEEENLCAEESDLTTAFEREINALASTVE